MFVFQGQCFIAVDPAVFAPGFKDRMADIMKNYREMLPVSWCRFMFNHMYKFTVSFAKRLSLVGVAYTYCQNKSRGLFATDYA